MNSFSALGDLMLATGDAVCACLEASAPLGAPGDCSVYWSTPPDDLFCDCAAGGFLNVWLEGMGPTNAFPQPFNGPVSSAIGPVRTMADIAVRLVRPCWPLPSVGANSQPTIPPRSVTEPLALGLAMDASIVMCCLLDDFTQADPGAMSSITGVPCVGVRMGRLIVDRNRGGCASFTVRYQVDVGSCCLPVGGS